MPNYHSSKPIGLILQEAGLISASQVEVALRDQKQFENLLLGEILSMRGWIKQETADFFVQLWPRMTQSQYKQPLGYYLKLAALLDEEQINILRQEQLQMGLRFGSLAVLKGWIKQTTLNFFLEHFAPQNKSDSPFIGKITNSQTNQEQVLFIGEPQIILPQTKSKKDIQKNLDLAEALDYSTSWLVTYKSE